MMRRSGEKRSARGFSLIEMMIVIAIIIGLVALTVGVSVTLHQKSEVRQVEQAFKLLDAALTEWELTAERKFTMGKDGTPIGARYDIQSDLPADKQVSVILDRMMATSACKEILAKIDPRMLIRDTSNPAAPTYKLIDPWDKPIVLIHPGRVWTQGDPSPDPDGTIFTRASTPNGSVYYNEENFGRCVNRQICFVSAGPDGKFGKISVDPTSHDYIEMQDNIYSYPLVRP